MILIEYDQEYLGIMFWCNMNLIIINLYFFCKIFLCDDLHYVNWLAIYIYRHTLKLVSNITMLILEIAS